MTIFKNIWEKTEEVYSLPEDIIEKIITQAFPENNYSYQVISGGCSNINIKLNIEDINKSYLLRIYINNKDAVYKEKSISKLLENKIPVAKILQVGICEGYSFSVTEYISGITLRELLISNNLENLNDIMYEVGVILSKVSAIKFKKQGFFDKNLNIIEKNDENIINKFFKDSIDIISDKALIDNNLINSIENYFYKNIKFLPDSSESSLVHGDFDPANILVNKVNNKWTVSCILDWEYSFSGSVLWDIANMLRYSFKMPDNFKKSFIKGLIDHNVSLSSDWMNSINLLNLVSLVDLLVRTNPTKQSNRYYDVVELIKNIIDMEKIIVRKYKKTDAKEIAEIYYNTIHKVNITDYTDEQVNAWAPLESLQTDGWIKKHEKLSPYVAIINDRVVGFAEFESDGHIDCFYCHHDYQGLGIGSALMNHIEKNAKQNKIKRIYAEVSITAKSFFLKKGFTVIKEQQVSIRNVKLKNFLMEKIICE